MTERGILFSAPMVRALRDGRKTQTRRPCKAMNKWVDQDCREVRMVDGEPYHFLKGATAPLEKLRCPYGEPGDRLWVRETWGVVSNAWGEDGNLVDWTPNRPTTAVIEMPFGRGYYSGHVIYAADGHYEWAGDDDGGGEPRSAWHPSIHMPRVASRILLEIVSRRVERLKDISEADVVAEGVEPHEVGQFALYGLNAEELADLHRQAAVGPYSGLWERINGAGSWNATPWVWVVEFKRVAP